MSRTASKEKSFVTILASRQASTRLEVQSITANRWRNRGAAEYRRCPPPTPDWTARRHARAAELNEPHHPAADGTCWPSDRASGCPCTPTTGALNARVGCRLDLLFVLSLELRLLPQPFAGARLPLIVLSEFPAPHLRQSAERRARNQFFVPGLAHDMRVRKPCWIQRLFMVYYQVTLLAKRGLYRPDVLAFVRRRPATDKTR